MGRAMMSIASVFSQLELETAGERIRDDMQELTKQADGWAELLRPGYLSKPVEKITIDGKQRKAFQLFFARRY